MTSAPPKTARPEATLQPDQVDRRWDIYAVGCVAFYLLTGQIPFDTSDTAQSLRATVELHPSAPSSRTAVRIPPELDALVLACLARHAAHRPQSAAALDEALASVPVDAPWTESSARDWWRLHSPLQNDAPLETSVHT